MKVKDLTREVEEFRAALVEHRDLYARSVDIEVADYPVENEKKLRAQSEQLSRMLGRLRPYLQRFRVPRLARHPMTGLTVDVLDVAVGMGHDVQTKGEVLDHAIDSVNQVIGNLQRFGPDDEVPDDPKSPVKSGTLGGAQRLVPTTRRVLVIHGHDDANLFRLAELLRERALEPIILRREPAKGRTLIEKFEQEASTCAFAFVLMTPDDQVKIAAPKEPHPETETLTGKPRKSLVAEVRAEMDKMRRSTKDGTEEYTQARPNVVFELGWVYGRLGRDRVCILFKKGTQIHSDLEGIERIEFNETVEEVVPAIERELKAAVLL